MRSSLIFIIFICFVIIITSLDVNDSMITENKEILTDNQENLKDIQNTVNTIEVKETEKEQSNDKTQSAEKKSTSFFPVFIFSILFAVVVVGAFGLVRPNIKKTTTLQQYINADVFTANNLNRLTNFIFKNNYDNLDNNDELKKIVYQALIKSHKNNHNDIKTFILNELKNRGISILSLNTLYNSANNLNKIKVLNFVSEEELVKFENLLDVLDIVEIVNPDQLNLDNFKNINNNLNIALASGDGTYNRYNLNRPEDPNVMKYINSARIHIYFPQFVFNDLNFINFNWIIENNFQNNILIIWLDIEKIPYSFINLFKNKVDYITSDDMTINISPEIANSILKQNGFIKVNTNDNKYLSNSNFMEYTRENIIKKINHFYMQMFNEGMGGNYTIYKKK